jgi:hypothetical protein
MLEPRFPPPLVSAALSRALNLVPDDGLKVKVDVLVAKSARALSAARALEFAGFEEREMTDRGLELWGEVAPRFSAALREISALIEAASHLFPKATVHHDDFSRDFDQAFDLLRDGDTHPVTGQVASPRSVHEKVSELVQSYAWLLAQAWRTENQKLREPKLLSQQWNLLGEIEEFRDKIIGTIHGMVAAVLGVFDEVEVETLFPDANEWVEMGVALRRQIADLAQFVGSHVTRLRAQPPPSTDELRMMLTQDDEATAFMLKLPVVACLHVADRHELTVFRREAAKTRTAPSVDLEAARQLLDGYGTFLASLQAVELKERLRTHDAEVAREAREAVNRAAVVLLTDARLAMLLLTHAGRRVARLYGLSSELDGTARELRELHGQRVELSHVQAVLTRMGSALEPIVQSA